MCFHQIWECAWQQKMKKINILCSLAWPDLEDWIGFPLLALELLCVICFNTFQAP